MSSIQPHLYMWDVKDILYDVLVSKAPADSIKKFTPTNFCTLCPSLPCYGCAVIGDELAHVYAKYFCITNFTK